MQKSRIWTGGNGTSELTVKDNSPEATASAIARAAADESPEADARASATAVASPPFELADMYELG
jgi:hypothetical protein